MGYNMGVACMGSQMMHDETFEGYPRPDLIQYVMDSSVVIPEEKMQHHDDMVQWLTEKFEEPRAGDILWEAMEGHLDYFEGAWCFLHGYQPSSLVWFARKQDRTLFSLTWL